MVKLKCHCEKVELEVKLPKKIENIVRCNCTLCKRKGTAMIPLGPNDLEIIKGKDILNCYQYHTKTAKHFFCSNCGIYTHHNPRRDPKSYVINAGCLDNIDIHNFNNIKNIDGRNHPLDKK